MKHWRKQLSTKNDVRTKPYERGRNMNMQLGIGQKQVVNKIRHGLLALCMLVVFTVSAHAQVHANHYGSHQGMAYVAEQGIKEQHSQVKDEESVLAAHSTQIPEERNGVEDSNEKETQDQQN